MTILPQKPRPAKDKPPLLPGSGGPPAQDIVVGHHNAIVVDTSPADATNSFLNRPSTSRLPPPSSSSQQAVVVVQQQQQQQQQASSSCSVTAVTDRDRHRLSKNLKRASATPPPNPNCQSLSSARRAKKELNYPSSLTSSSSSIRHHNSETEKACNSEDEYSPDIVPEDASLVEREIRFERLMKEKGLDLRRMAEDGGCLFRAVADQVYGDQRWHDVVRRQCIAHMEKNRDYYSAFVTEEFDAYLKRKSRLDCFGNNIEIQALSELYGRPVEIYRYSTEPINIFQTDTPSSYPPLRLSYHNRSHYNSLVSPYDATVGVGLGLPGYQPGIADRNLMREASLMSENCELEKAMLEDKLRETDWEKTQEALEKQVARESYVQWLREQEDKLLVTSNDSMYDIPSTSQDDRSTSVVIHNNSSSSGGGGETNNNGNQTDLLQSTSKPDIAFAEEEEEKKAKEINEKIDNGDDDDINNTSKAESSSLFDTAAQHLTWEDWIVDEGDEEDVMLAVLARSQEDYINSFSKQLHQDREASSSKNSNSTSK